MRVLVDTNILARLAQPAHHHHEAATRALDTIILRKASLYIVPQVVYEFWAIATRTSSANGLALSPVQAEVKLREARRMFTLLLDERAVFAEWQKLVTAHAVTGKLAHDARLVAAMVRHGLTHVLTFNTKDFARFSPIQTLSPETIAAESAG